MRFLNTKSYDNSPSNKRPKIKMAMFNTWMNSKERSTPTNTRNGFKFQITKTENDY